MAAVAALRHQELAALATVRGIDRRRGHAAINADYVRYVAKRSPPGALPDEAWAFLVAGGTGLRKSDLMWAVPALAAHLDQTGTSKQSLTRAQAEWATIADYLRSTRLKVREPWAVMRAAAHAWHHRAGVAKARKEAQKSLKGGKPANKPFIRFPDGAFGVVLTAAELDLEGAACGHCLRGSRSYEQHFSLRTRDNLPFFSGSFTVGDKADPGVRFVESKGNFNVIAPEHTAYAREAWKALARRFGKITRIGAATDFAALWLPRELKRQRRFEHDTLATAPLAAFTAFLDDAHGLVDWTTLAELVGAQTAAKTPPETVIERFSALSARDPGAGIAFARSLPTTAFTALADRDDVPAALVLLKMGKRTRTLLGSRRSQRWKRRVRGEDRTPQPFLAANAAKWRKVAARTDFATAAALDEGGLGAWLLLAPRASVRPLMLEAARRPADSALLRIILKTEDPGLDEAFVYRALQLPRRDLRLLAASMPASWREMVRWLRPDIPVRGGLLKRITSGTTDLSDHAALVVNLLRGSDRVYSAVTKRVTTAIEDVGWDWYDLNQGAYVGDRPEEEVAEDLALVWNLAPTLWTLINTAPQKIGDEALLDAVQVGIMLERTLTEGEVNLQDCVVEELGEALGRRSVALAARRAAGTLTTHDIWGYEELVGLVETMGMLEYALGAVVTAVSAGQVSAAAFELINWVDSNNPDGWLSFVDYWTGEERAEHIPGVVWAVDRNAGWEPVLGEKGDDLWKAFDAAATDVELAAGKLFADTWGLPYGPRVQAHADKTKAAKAS